MIDVTAAIIIRDGKVFIAKRSANSNLPGKWEFPGGKTDEGETPQECLARELNEEFDIAVTSGEFVVESEHHYEQKTVRLVAFEVSTG
jgi:8-oxo-dGTP diphosphatase